MLHSSKRAAGVAVTVMAIGATAAAYSTFGRWGTSSVDFYVNPKSADVTATAAISALQTGAGVWSDQSRAAFRFVYAGQTTDTSTAYDGRNVVLFRNTTNGSAIASTYTWSSGGNIVDTDIVFWDGGFKFFTGSSGCGGSNAAYIEDIAAHEFGHALGLNHSTVSGATMYAGYSTCSQSQRTLASDDIAGVESLYPSSTSTNQAPKVAISAPSNGASVAEGTAITFSGSASDTEDGNLSSKITWKSNLSGAIGTGSLLTKLLPAGSHAITATVKDSAGLSASTTVSITVTTSSVQQPTSSLSASGYKVKGQQKADLRWQGLTSSSVDILRNGAIIARVSNTGSRTDHINAKGGGSYTYTVCEAATKTCTNKAVVSF